MHIQVRYPGKREARGLGIPGTGLAMLIHHVGTGKRTQHLWKSSQSSLPPGHLSSPRFGSFEMCSKDQACLKLLLSRLCLLASRVEVEGGKAGCGLCRACLGSVR